MPTWEELSPTPPSELSWDSLSATPPKPPEGGFIPSAKQSVGSLIKGAGQAAADYIPGVDQDNAVKAYGQKIIEANPTAVHNFGDIADKPLTAVTEAAGNAGSSIGGMVGARVLGQGITAMSPFAGPLAPAVALAGQAVSWLGPAAIAALPSYGGIRDKQILNDPANQDDWKSKAIASVGAATVGAIESKFGPQDWALSALTKEGRAALASKFAETTLAKSIGFGALKGAAIEGAEELVQNPIEQLASYDNPTTPENLKETAFSGVMGAIGGGVFGGATGMVSPRAKTPQQAVNDIANAPDVDSAIKAAEEAVNAAPKVDDFLASLQTMKDTARSGGVLQRLRDMGDASPVSTSDFLNALSVAQNPVARMDQRIQARDQVNQIIEQLTSGSGFTMPGDQAESAPATSTALATQQGGALATPVQGMQFDPNTIDGQTRFVDELPGQRAIGGPRALTGPTDTAPIEPTIGQLTADTASTRRQDPRLIPLSRRDQAYQPPQLPQTGTALTTVVNPNVQNTAPGTAAEAQAAPVEAPANPAVAANAQAVPAAPGNSGVEAAGVGLGDKAIRTQASVATSAYDSEKKLRFADFAESLAGQSETAIRKAITNSEFGASLAINELDGISKSIAENASLVADQARKNAAPKAESTPAQKLEAQIKFQKLRVEQAADAIRSATDTDRFGLPVENGPKKQSAIKRHADAKQKLSELEGEFESLNKPTGANPGEIPDNQPTGKGSVSNGTLQTEKTTSGKPPASWVIKSKETGEVVMETFDKAKVDALNTAKYEAVPILDHLVSLSNPTDSSNAARPVTLPVYKPEGPVFYGTGHRLLTEGGKPFKTKRAADDAKKLQSMMRVKKVKGGYVLTEKTPAQIAAQARAADRLAAGSTGDAGMPQHAHGFLAREGGLSKATMSDLGFDKNHRIGSMWLFKANDGMTLERATEKLIEGGYLREGASHSDAINLVKKSITTPQYTADGWDRIAQAEADARFEDHLAEQEEAAQNDDFDPFESLSVEGFTAQDDEYAGYSEAADPIKLEVNALIEQADALGIEIDDIRESSYEATKNGSEQDYLEHLSRAIAQAIAGSNQDSGGNVGEQGNQASERAEDFLVSPSREDILAKQQAEQDAAKAKEKADKEQEEKDRAERIQKEIDARQAASAENFTLGQNAEDALAGQGDVFNQPAQSEFSSIEKNLQSKAVAQEFDDSIGVVMPSGKVHFVTLQDAVSAANSAIANGTKPVPFQIHNETGIRIGDVDRVLKAASTTEPAAQPNLNESDALPMAFGQMTQQSEKLTSKPGGSWVLTQGEPKQYANRQYSVWFSWGNGKYSAGDVHDTAEAAYKSALKRWTDRGNKPEDFKQIDKSEFTPDLQSQLAEEPAAQATAILDAAEVKGKERIDVLKDVKSGTITPEEVQAAYPAKEVTNDRDNFTLERMNRESGQMESVTFSRGEYVQYSVGTIRQFGEIDGISQAKREFSVDGLWYPFGYAYKATRPEEAKKETVPLSSVIDSVNQKYGQGLTDADAVPTSENVLAAEAELWGRLTDGTATVEEFKAGFERWVKNKDIIVEGFLKKKKDELLKTGSQMFAYRNKSENKQTIAEALWRDTASDYILGQSLMYGMGRDSWLNAVRAKVENTDATQLAEFAAERKAAQSEALARVESIAEAIKDPKTLDDYITWMRATMSGGKTFKEARMLLTPDQRAQYDELAAADSRGNRKVSTEVQKARINVAGQVVDGDIIATKHTQNGNDLFVVQLAERVSKEDYTTLNTGAKQIGGYYSSYRGRGAVPGFTFPTREQAQAFVKLAQGDNAEAQAAAQERRDAFADDRSQTAVERLTEMADRLESQATSSLNQERKQNTAKRASQAASAEAAANAEKAMARTMRNIANSIAEGRAKFLDRVRQKSQVALLQSFVATAKGTEIRAKYESYSEQERHKGEAPTNETADFAEFPTYVAYRSDLASLGRQLLAVDGTKLIGQRLMKVADDVSDAFNKFAKENTGKLMAYRAKDGGLASFGSKDAAQRSIDISGYRGKAVPYMVKRGEYTIILSPSEAIDRGLWTGDGDKRITLSSDFGAELVEKIGKASRRGSKVSVPWQFESAHDKRKALERLGIETPAEFRAALREFINQQEQSELPNKVKELERSMIGRKNDGLDFFPTPESVADEMVSTAGIEPGMTVLEPSAGWGHIAERIRSAGVEPDVGEMASSRVELLEAKGFNVVSRDFMDINPRGFTYGDVFKHKDGRVGVLGSNGGLGSSRYKFIPVNGDGRTFDYVDREDLTGIEKRGTNSGYDRILMNPPFSDGRDIDHVKHAYSLLKPGGRIVAIMGESAFTNQNKKATEFREWLESIGGTEEKLAEGTFQDPNLPVNTGANARMVVIDRSADAGFGAPMASRTIDAQDTAVISQVQTWVNQLSAKWKNGPEIQVVSSIDDLPVPAAGDTRGLYYQGTVYLVANRIGSLKAVGEVLGHESIAHFGLREMLGQSDWYKFMRQMQTAIKSGNKPLNAIRDQIRSVYVDENGKANLTEIEEADEIAAKAIEMAIDPKTGEFNPGFGFLKSVFAKVAQFLRDMGFDVKFTNLELQGALVNAMRNLEVGHRTEGGIVSPAIAARQDQTQTPEFKRWYSDQDGQATQGNDAGRTSGVATDTATGPERSGPVDAKGRPVVFYHGTKDDFNTFDIYHPNRKDNGWLGRGVYGISDPDLASTYANLKQGAGDSNVMPLYFAVKNPYEISLESKRKLSKAPQEYIDAFTQKVKDLGHDGVILKFNDGTMEIVAFEPTQVKSATGNNGQFDPNNPDIRYARDGFDSAMASRSPIQSNTWNSPSTSKFDDIVYTLQNKQIDTKRVVEAIKQAGKNVAESVDVYLREELFHGRSAKRTEDFLNNELTPLLNDMKARGISLEQIDKYLHARHAEEANNLIASRNPDMPDGGSGMKTQEAKDYLNSLGAAERNRLDAVAKKIDGMISTTRQLYADEGLESQDTVDSWGTMFKHYVPLMREDKDGGIGIGQGFSIKGKETKGRVGSSRAVVDILANIAMQREKVIVRGEKNRVATALVGLAVENPNPDFWTVGETPHEKVYDPKTNSVVDRIDPMYKSRENVVVAKVTDPDGSVKEVAVVFNEDNERAVRMAASLKNLDALQLNGLLGLSAKISRYISSINTQYNPIFGVVNLVRDVQGAMVNLSTTDLKGQEKEVSKHVLSALKGVYLDARAMREGKTASSTWAALHEEFQNLGGQTGYRDLFATSEDRAKALQSELTPYAWMDGTLGKVFTANGVLKVPMSVAQDKAKGLFDWLSDYNLAMENAVRLSAYKVGIDQGLTKERAASLAKNLTVNFNRKGQISQQAGALYAFFNAGVQGTARLSQVLFEMDGSDAKTIRLSETGKKVVAGGVMLGVAQAVMLAAAGFGDDDPPEFVRERNLIIPTGGKSYITIPMPLGLHVLPNVGRVSTEFAMSGFKDPAKRAAKLFGLFTDAFNPMGGSSSLLQMLSPTPIDPLVAIAENKDGLGRSIAKTSRNPAVPGYTLAKDTASKPAKLIAEAINYLSGGTEYKAGLLSPTPDQVDFLIGQATGGVGRELSKIDQSARALVTGEELPMHKIPLVGRFYGDSDLQSSQANAFYSAIKRIEEHELEIKGLRKDGKGEELSAYFAENPEAQLVPMANRVELQIQKLQTKKREMMKRDADAEQIKAIENQIKERMKVFNMVVRNLREKQPA